MLFATKREHPDTGSSIFYLTTIVRDPHQSNWTKMVHLFKYVRGTKDLPLILSADNSGILKFGEITEKRHDRPSNNKTIPAEKKSKSYELHVISTYATKDVDFLPE